VPFWLDSSENNKRMRSICSEEKQLKSHEGFHNDVENVSKGNNIKFHLNFILGSFFSHAPRVGGIKVAP
jgi:hypothetical protein